MTNNEKQDLGCLKIHIIGTPETSEADIIYHLDHLERSFLFFFLNAKQSIPTSLFVDLCKQDNPFFEFSHFF